MMPTAACMLYEPDGTLLTRGRCFHSAACGPDALVVTAEEAPGRLVQRCMGGAVQEVELQVAHFPRVPARLERLFYDPQLGRACIVRLRGA